MAGLLCFWGGVQNGYWAFSHNPTKYAYGVSCSALLLFGELDNRVTREETELIFKNLKSNDKMLKIYPDEGHDVFYGNEDNWATDIAIFLEENM